MLNAIVYALPFLGAGLLVTLLVSLLTIGLSLVVGALLYCTSGSAWSGVVAALLLWLVADRLLDRRALYDLWKLTCKDTSP